MGKHTFKYALLPHEGMLLVSVSFQLPVCLLYTGEFQTAGVIKRAYELNYPLRLHCSCGGTHDALVGLSLRLYVGFCKMVT